MDCLDAIILGDGREMFVLNEDLSITSYIDKFCIVAKDLELIEN